MDGGFRYSHDKINTIPYDAIVLSATDGKFDSQMILNITVTQVDKSAPILLSSAVCRLYVKEGKTQLGQLPSYCRLLSVDFMLMMRHS